MFACGRGCGQECPRAAKHRPSKGRQRKGYGLAAESYTIETGRTFELQLDVNSHLRETHDRFNALSTARMEASSMLVSTPAPQRLPPLPCLIWM